jgi:hypothetical protein
MRTAPVNQSDGPLPDGLLPILVISIILAVALLNPFSMYKYQPIDPVPIKVFKPFFKDFKSSEPPKRLHLHSASIVAKVVRKNIA